MNVFASQGLALGRNTRGISVQDVFVTLGSAGEKGNSFGFVFCVVSVLFNNKATNKAVTSPLSWKKKEQKPLAVRRICRTALCLYSV